MPSVRNTPTGLDDAIVRLTVLRCLIVCTGLAWGLATAASGWAETTEYRLGSGDQVRVTVFGHQDLSGDFQIDGSGVIALPLIGNVEAGAQTVRELEYRIVHKLKPDYLKNPRVNIEVLNYRPFYIIGEVKKPGSYPYVSGMTVINAIALAGGYTYRARENRLYLRRSSGSEKDKRAADHDTKIMPGDVIEVPERFF